MYSLCVCVCTLCVYKVSLKWILQEVVVLLLQTVLYPEGGHGAYIINGLHRRFPALLKLLLVLGRAAGEEADLEVAHGRQQRETEDEDKGQLPGGGKGYHDSRAESGDCLEQDAQTKTSGLYIEEVWYILVR